MNNNIFNDIDEKVKEHLLQTRMIKDFYCKECGKLLLDIEELKKLAYIDKTHAGKQRTKAYFGYKDSHALYKESDANRWLFFGKVLDRKTYYRQICWNCFFKRLRQEFDIERLARKCKWYTRVMNGENPIPARSTTPSKYFKFLFNVSDEVLAKEKLKFDTASLESFIRRYGEEDGKKKYDAYRTRQAYTCSKEYMKEKRNWTEEQWNEFNASRASTKENFIKRYGEKLGIEKWNKYCENEAYTGCALQYFKDKYGNMLGIQKYLEVNAAKAPTLENFINKYGENEGRKKFLKIKKAYSEISQQLFQILDNSLGIFATESRYAIKGKLGEAQIFVQDSELDMYKVYRPDYLLNNKIIEFNGDFWHANPKYYSANDELPRFDNTKVVAKELWEADKKRYDALEKLGYKIKVVWESDYNENSKQVIADCLKFLKF